MFNKQFFRKVQFVEHFWGFRWNFTHFDYSRCFGLKKKFFGYFLYFTDFDSQNFFFDVLLTIAGLECLILSVLFI